jgi:hypothetical protein
LANKGEDASKVRELGWRQGAVLPPSLFAAVQGATDLTFKEGESFPVVVSQDCDVAHQSYTQEPDVGIVRATIIPYPNGNFRYAKSARTLHTDCSLDGAQKTLELKAQDRRRLDRRILEGSGPDNKVVLKSEDVVLLGRWLANRFRRASFPDEFDRRLADSGSKEALSRLFAKRGVDISGVYVLLRPDNELSSKDSYELTVWLTVPKHIFDDQTRRESLEETLRSPCESILRRTPGFRVVGIMLVSEEFFSLNDVRYSRRMDFDSLTYRSSTGFISES